MTVADTMLQLGALMFLAAGIVLAWAGLTGTFRRERLPDELDAQD